MTDHPHPKALSFEGEVPLPEVNTQIYRRLYVIEQWLRRIVLAALTARYGTAWHTAIPSSIFEDAQPRLNQLKNRVAFDTENSDNIIWCLTLDELKNLLIYEKTWDHVKALTGFDRGEIRARLDDIREIRNVIGHNRAATVYTGKIFDAIAEALDDGIENFRDRLLYDFTGKQKIGEEMADPVIAEFYNSNTPMGTRHMGSDEYFYYIYVIPGTSDFPLELGSMLEHFDAARRTVLAFLVNRQSLGDYTIMWPRAASPEEHSMLLETFDGFMPVIGEPYLEQSAKFVCHPKIWFVF